MAPGETGTGGINGDGERVNLAACVGAGLKIMIMPGARIRGRDVFKSRSPYIS